MAFGSPAFIDFDPDPSGNGYHFKKPTGESVYAYGDEADRLARTIAATKPPDMRTAMNAPPELTGGGDIPGAGTAGVPDVGKPPLGAENPSAPQGDVTVGEITTAKPALPPRIEPPPTGALPTTAGAARPAASAQAEKAPLTISPVKYVGGTNPAAMAKNAVAVPTAESVTVQGGITDPAERAKLLANQAQQEEAQRGLMGVQESILKQQQSQAETDALNAALQKQQAERQVAEGEAQKTLLRQEFQKRTAIAQHELDQQSSREVDQFRLFRGKPGAQIAALIGGIIGAFGQGFSGGTNAYADVVNRYMDNDIAAQRQEIQQGVAKANNDLARIKETYGLDYDDAASVLKLAYVQKTEAEATRRAALVGGQQAQMNLASLQPAFLKWKADAEAAMQAKLLGQVQVTRQSRMMQPSRGGLVAKTPEEMAKEAEAHARYEHAANVVRHGGVAQKEGGEADKGAYTTQTISAINAAQTAEESLRHAAALGGITLDADGNVKDVDHLKLAWAKANPASAYNKALEAAVPEMVRGQTGAAPTEEGQKHARAQFGGLVSDPNAFQESVKLLRAARKVRLENKKMPIAGGGNSSGSDREE